MAGIPESFKALSNVLPTYNYVDIASGTGYITFYLGKTVDLNLISNSTFYSDTISTPELEVAANIPNGSTNAVILDVDFDTLLNRPLLLAGLGIVNVPFYITSGNAGQSITGIIRAKLRKWDGVTETEIVSNDSTVLTCTGVVTKYLMTATDLNIPITMIKKGEYLRLTIQAICTSAGVASNDTVRFAHDPKNRTTGGDATKEWDTTGAVPSQLTFQCPVRLNL